MNFKQITLKMIKNLGTLVLKKPKHMLQPLGLVLISTPAFTQSNTIYVRYDASQKLCVGDQWTWQGNEYMASSTWKITVADVSAGVSTLKRETKPETGKKRERLETMLANGNVASLGELAYTPDNQELAFPLQVGKTWKVLHTYPADTVGTLTKDGNAKVVAHEQIHTKAGSLDVYRIQQQGNLSNNTQMNWRASYQHIYWYAPAAKGIVKFEYAHQATRGGNALRSGEVTAFNVANCN
jgi:hypothetical protein